METNVHQSWFLCQLSDQTKITPTFFVMWCMQADAKSWCVLAVQTLLSSEILLDMNNCKQQIAQSCRRAQLTSGRLQHPWQSSVHVPGWSMCWMEVHIGVTAARGVTVVTGVQRADCREHTVSQILRRSPALQLYQRQQPHLSAATSTSYNTDVYLVTVTGHPNVN